MKNRRYSLMLVPESGQVRNFSISHRAVQGIAASLVGLLLFGFWGLFLTFTGGNAGEMSRMQQSLELAKNQYQIEVGRLRGQLDEKQKQLTVYAKSIGEIQARLSRLDSLGEHLVSKASLKSSEFDFGITPAFGGPQVNADTQGREMGMDEAMGLLATHLSQVDAQLEAIDYSLQKKQGEMAARPHALPTSGGMITSTFGSRADPFSGEKAMHKGIDISNRIGTPVVASSHGIVTFAGKMQNYGYVVFIAHGFGYVTRYGHLGSLNVKTGDEVDVNQMIGRVGSTGRSTGPHLHYEVLRYGQHLNPSNYLPRA